MGEESSLGADDCCHLPFVWIRIRWTHTTLNASSNGLLISCPPNLPFHPRLSASTVITRNTLTGHQTNSSWGAHPPRFPSTSPPSPSLLQQISPQSTHHHRLQHCLPQHPSAHPRTTLSTHTSTSPSRPSSSIPINPRPLANKAQIPTTTTTASSMPLPHRPQQPGTTPHGAPQAHHAAPPLPHLSSRANGASRPTRLLPLSWWKRTCSTRPAIPRWR